MQITAAFLGLCQQYNRVCQWRLVWRSQGSRIGRFEASTWWCMLCSLSYLSVCYSRKKCTDDW